MNYFTPHKKYLNVQKRQETPRFVKKIRGSALERMRYVPVRVGCAEKYIRSILKYVCCILRYVGRIPKYIGRIFAYTHCT